MSRSVVSRARAAVAGYARHGLRYPALRLRPQTQRTADEALIDLGFDRARVEAVGRDFAGALDRLLSRLAERAREVGESAYAERLLDRSQLAQENRRLIYSAIRLVQPEVAVETGTFNGVTTAFALQALSDNGVGRLVSLDLPARTAIAHAVGRPLPRGEDPGWIVPFELRERLELVFGDARRTLPEVLRRVDEIGVFLHDSLHTTRHMLFEYRHAWAQLEGGRANQRRRFRDAGLLDLDAPPAHAVCTSRERRRHQEADVSALALIPARGGSKGIPRKNLADVAGKPLIAWTIEAARAASSIDRIVVSTDDDEIAALSRTLGAEVLDRPRDLAADETPMIDVLVHAADALAAGVVILLQPTSPLRRAEHVDAAFALFADRDADCVVSVVEVPHNFRPEKLVSLEGDRVVTSPEAEFDRHGVSAFARNGPAVLVVRTAGLAERGLYGGDVRAFRMSAADSVDVDDADDLRLADAVLRARATG